jgi:hypothetical protein
MKINLARDLCFIYGFIAKLHIYLTALGSQQKTFEVKFLTKKKQVKSTLLNYKDHSTFIPQSQYTNKHYV